MPTIKLREVAHSRAGEKGDSVNLSVIAYREEDYPIIKEQVSVEKVREIFGPIVRGKITRYEAPNIGALNFLIEKALDGGRSRNLAFDESGKALSSLVYRMDIEVPEGYVGRSGVQANKTHL